ncbi:ParA family protein [Anaerosporobacter faecicola]|uniref:ParA family protein n=1 Tax=Anaerosporobacter faecicola TaxID=2718714 RepID=UPI0014395503|nr:ParA family protein [Anaerosporobacter faecicola]
MRTIAIINLKGGVAKTTTAINMSIILSELHQKRVLLVDNDIQANASKFFNLHDYDKNGIENVFRNERVATKELIERTSYENMDMIPTNMNLDNAVSELMQEEGDQIGKLKKALKEVESEYDYCLIDCPPSIAMNVLNAIVAADDIIIPIKLDKHALDGMEELIDVIDELVTYNKNLENIMCLPVMTMKDEFVLAGEKLLRESNYRVFDTNIRYSVKVIGSTFQSCVGITEYSPRCSAAKDYKGLVEEYLRLVKDGE